MSPPPTAAGASRTELTLQHRGGEDVAADAPAAVDHLVDQHERVCASALAVHLGVEVGDDGDHPMLLLGGDGAGRHLEICERHLLRFGCRSGKALPAFDKPLPPLTRITWPLTQWPAGLARKATSVAESSGAPSRSSGGSFAIRSSSAASLPSRNIAVAVGPGATALTVMSLPRSSCASVSVSPSTAPLLAA